MPSWSCLFLQNNTEQLINVSYSSLIKCWQLHWSLPLFPSQGLNFTCTNHKSRLSPHTAKGGVCSQKQPDFALSSPPIFWFMPHHPCRELLCFSLAGLSGAAEQCPVRGTGGDREHVSEKLWETLIKKSGNGRPATETIIPVIEATENQGFFPDWPCPLWHTAPQMVIFHWICQINAGKASQQCPVSWLLSSHNRQMGNSECQSGILYLHLGDHLDGAEDTAEPSVSYGSFSFK